MFAPFPPTDLARDCLRYTMPVLQKVKALEDIAWGELQKCAEVEIYQNDADRAEPVKNITSSQELKRV